MLDGDDETNGMCPIIGPGRDVHIVGLSAPNTPKHSTLFAPSPSTPPFSHTPLSPFSSFALSVASRSSVCLFIRLRVYLFIRSLVFNMPFARTRVYEFTLDIATHTGRAEIGGHKIFI